MRDKNKSKVLPRPPFGISSTALQNVSGDSKTTVPYPNIVYQNCQQYTKRQNKDIIVSMMSKHVFVPQQWIHYYRLYLRDANGKRALLKIVQIGTIHALVRGRYHYVPPNTTLKLDGNEEVITETEQTENDNENDDITPAQEIETDSDQPILANVSLVHINKKNLQQSVQSTRMMRFESAEKRKKYDEPTNVANFTTVTQVIEGDCLELALYLKNKHKCNPAMLIMASQSHPGGGYQNGSFAQEENICRRTNLFMCLDDPYVMDSGRNWNYPLPEFGGVYVPSCLVIRDSEENGYAFLQKPEQMSMIVSCAYSNPPVEKRIINGDEENVEWRLSGKIVKSIRRKIECIFDMAVQNKHDAIVLSALGCGAYCNPPKHMAELFKQVLNEKYAQKFKFVFFGIYDDKNAINNAGGNVKPFAQVFHHSDSAPTFKEFVNQS
jgi:uncharacterized protein (TIGR02452 family)